MTRQTLAVLFAAGLLSADAQQPADRPLKLSYAAPAQDWQSQALPIGNGRLGAMVFGGPEREHLQLNEISLWTGDERDTGRYQNLADLFIGFSHGPATGTVIRQYHRELDLRTATHAINYDAGQVEYSREYFASFPHQVLVFRFSANARGAYTGTIRLVDAHKAITSAKSSTLVLSGKLENGLAYETQVEVAFRHPLHPEARSRDSWVSRPVDDRRMRSRRITDLWMTD
jgi:alpha-L-fucosidase 2